MSGIAFYLSIIHCNIEFGSVVEYCIEEGEDVSVLIGWSGKSAKNAEDKYRALGASIIPISPEMLYGDQELSSGVAKRLSDEIRDTDRSDRTSRPIIGFVSRIVGFVHTFAKMWSARKHSSEIVKSLKPDVFVVGCDHSHGKLYNGILAACLKQGIPTIGLATSPIISTETAKRSRFYRLKDGVFQKQWFVDFDILNRFLAKLFPNWVCSNDSLSIFMWDPLDMLAAMLLRLQDDDPWCVPSHLLTRYCTHSEHARKLLHLSKYPMDKVRVCGMPLLDDVSKMLLNKSEYEQVLNDINLVDGQPFILWNMAPSWEHGVMTKTEHFSQVHGIQDILSECNMPVIISLHPLCAYDNYKFLERDSTFLISRNWKIHYLYPLCSFVVSFMCSTNQLASEFNKQIILLDCEGKIVDGGPSAIDHNVEGAILVHSLGDLRDSVQNQANKLRDTRIEINKYKGRSNTMERIVKEMRLLVSETIDGHVKSN